MAHRLGARRPVTLIASLIVTLIAGVLLIGCADDGDGPGAAPTTAPTIASTTVLTTGPPSPAGTTPVTDPPATDLTTTTTTISPTTTTAPVASPPGYPAQQPDVAWPTDEWPTGDLPAGVDRAAIDAAVDTAFGGPEEAARVRAVLVVHGGRLVYERYHPLDGPDTVFPSYSVAKSVTSTLVGMAVADGLLDVEAPAPVPEWQAPGDPRAAITLDDLLRMSSGLEWRESYQPGDDPMVMLREAEHAADVPIAKPLVADPGTTFNYSTGTSAILTDVLADALGGPAALDAFIAERLMAPLGITSTQVQRDPSGTFLGGVGFDSSARDFARFGLLHLRGGVWDGAELLPPEWLGYVRTPSPTNASYGAHWWLRDDGGFAALGLFGQHVIVVPDLDLVVVVTANPGSDPYGVTGTVVEQFAAAG